MKKRTLKNKKRNLLYEPKKQSYFASKKDTKISTYDLDISNLEYSVIEESQTSKQPNILEVKFNTGMTLRLKNHLIFFESSVDEKDSEKRVVSVKWLKKWDHYCYPIYKTWVRSIEKYSKEPLFCYTVKPIYKYFPIIIEKENDSTITVNNYCGVKLKFAIKFDQDVNRVSLNYENGLITYETTNDIIAGSILDKFKALRYKIKLNRRDRRVFIDGFMVTKKVLYKNEQGIYEER